MGILERISTNTIKLNDKKIIMIMIDYLKRPSTDYLSIILNEQNIIINKKELIDHNNIDFNLNNNFKTQDSMFDNIKDPKIELTSENNDKMEVSKVNQKIRFFEDKRLKENEINS